MQARGAGGAKLYVAVVDDDDSVCRAFSRLLRTAGFEPIAYASAESFLGDAKRPRFDCLVLDIQLDGLSGLDLRQRLHGEGDTTPVIFITAYDAPEARARALACGCAAYFRKTDAGALILDAIARAVRPPIAPPGDPVAGEPA